MRYFTCLNNYLDDLNPKFTPIFKQMFLSPYYYLFRQLDTQEPIKFIYLDGKGKIGKTTTLKSMLRFVHPDSGKVVINGFDIEGVDYEKDITDMREIGF